MKLTREVLREYKEFCSEHDLTFRDVIEEIENENINFEIENYRFIHADHIDAIQQEELASDTYVLGCFSDWFLADNTDLSYEIITALQKAEEYEAIGQHILDNNLLKDIQKGYVNSDGYGHHFGIYDGDELEVRDYYVFRID